MKKRLVVRAVALATLTLFAIAGTALAAAWSERTSLTAEAFPGTTIDENERVTFSGKLHSDRKRCKFHQTLYLVREGKGVVFQTLTTRNGAYEFPSKKLRKVGNTVWQVIFEGFTEGVHPNIHTCRASESRVITITVED